MSIEKKLSTGTALLFANLKKECDDVVTAEGAGGDHEIVIAGEKLGELLEGYTTKVSTGEEVSVTPLDIEKVGNFRRDFQNASRLFTAEHGHAYLGKNEEAESFRATFNLADSGLSVQSAFFRPGKEDSGSTNFVSITDAWTGSDEDKAIESHLKSLSRKLAKGGK